MTRLMRQPADSIIIPAVAIAAVAAACAVLWPVAFAGRVPAYGDNVSFWAPNTSFWAAEVKTGRFPLWNPYILCGVPFAADINHGIFYPPNWIVLYTGVAQGLRLLVLAHVAVGILGVYLFARRQNLTRPAALWVGVLFGISESFLPLCNHVVMLESMSYIGFALCLARRLADGGGTKAAGLLGLVLALSALAGDVHATFIISIAVAVVVTVGVMADLKDRRIVEAGALLVKMGVAAMLAVFLAAVAVVPALQLVKLSQRAAGGGEYAGYHSLDPASFVGAFLPGVWGSIADGTVWNFRAGNALYVGVVLAFLAVYGVRKLKGNGVPIALVVAGVLLASGHYGPLWGILQGWLPGFKLFRQPREYFVIACIGVCVLAGKGISQIGAGGVKRRGAVCLWRVSLFGFIAIAALAVTGLAFGLPAAFGFDRFLSHIPAQAGGVVFRSICTQALVTSLFGIGFSVWRLGRLPGKAVAAMACVLVVVDAALASGGWLAFGPGTLCEGRSPLAQKLKAAAHDGQLRFASTAPGFGEYFEAFARRRYQEQSPDETDGLTALVRVKECLVDDESLYEGIPNAMGYSTFITTRYAALWNSLTGVSPSPVRLRVERPVSSTGYRMLGVGAVVEASGEWTDCRVADLDQPAIVRMVYDWSSVDSFSQALEAFAAAGERAWQAPVIEGLPRWFERPKSPQVRHALENVWRGADSFRLRVFTDEPGVLLLAECNYPGWKAYDNGAEVPIYNANLAYRAVCVPAGRHEFEFRFRPALFYISAVLSATAVLALLAIFESRRSDRKDA